MTWGASLKVDCLKAIKHLDGSTTMNFFFHRNNSSCTAEVCTPLFLDHCLPRTTPRISFFPPIFASTTQLARSFSHARVYSPLFNHSCKGTFRADWDNTWVNELEWLFTLRYTQFAVIILSFTWTLAYNLFLYALLHSIRSYNSVFYFNFRLHLFCLGSVTLSSQL